jgi:hypothetical protein
LLFLSPFRVGLHGIEEIKTHPWFEGLNWNNLLAIPAPYVPQGSHRIKNALEEMQKVPSGTVEFRQLIREITANFDKFQEGPSEGATRNSKNPLIQNKSPTEEGKGQPEQQLSPSNAFEGYTFVRQPKVDFFCIPFCSVLLINILYFASLQETTRGRLVGLFDQNTSSPTANSNPNIATPGSTGIQSTDVTPGKEE